MDPTLGAWSTWRPHSLASRLKVTLACQLCVSPWPAKKWSFSGSDTLFWSSPVQSKHPICPVRHSHTSRCCVKSAGGEVFWLISKGKVRSRPLGFGAVSLRFFFRCLQDGWSEATIYRTGFPQGEGNCRFYQWWWLPGHECCCSGCCPYGYLPGMQSELMSITNSSLKLIS